MAERIPSLLLYGVVGEDTFGEGFTATTVANWLNENADAPELEVRISSGGGFVDTGLSVFNLLKGCNSKITVKIDSIAASAASLIAMAGDEIIMGEGALYMVHSPWNVAMGNAAEMRKMANVLDKQNEQFVSIYAARTGQPEDKIREMLEAETWLDANEALELGFATAMDGKASERSMASVRLDFLKLQHGLPAPIAQAREHHPDLVPQARPLRAVAAATTVPPAAASGRDAQAGRHPAAEVITEKPMTASAASAATTPADTHDPKPAASKAQAPDTQPKVVPIDEAAAQRLRDEASREGSKAERSRIKEVDRLVTVAASKMQLPDGFRDQMVDTGKTPDEVRAAIFDAMANAQAAAQPETRAAVRVEGGEDRSEKWMKGAQAALIQRAGLSKLIERASKGAEKVDPGEFAGMSPKDLAADYLAEIGVKAASRRPMDIVAKAFTTRRSQAKIDQGTTDFTVLLENTMNKTLQAAYADVPNTWSRFAKTGTVSDFRQNNRYRRGSFGTLDTVNELGEFKYKPIPDGEKGVISIGTKGNIIAVSRQALINDDMGFLSDQAVDLGRAAAYSVEVDVYTLLSSNSGLGPTMTDGLTLFHASHLNIISVAAAPSVDSFEAARVQMAVQRDPSGKRYVAMRPGIWVGPIGLGGNVKVINQAQYDVTVSNKFQVPNKVNGMLADIVDTAELAGTRWYIFADPMVAPVLEVAFLDGVQEPFMDSQEGWTVDGTEWKVRLDYGVAATDYRGAITNAGA